MSIPRHHNATCWQELRETPPPPPTFPAWRSPLVWAGVACFASAVGLAAGWEPADVFQPTWVGILWAGVYLIGYVAGGPGRGQARTLLVAGAGAYVAWLALAAVTDLGKSECLLLTAGLLCGGWAAGRLPGRWLIWDLGFAAVIVACGAYAVPRLQTPPMLFFAVATALGSGLLGSWMACVWAWRDDWNWLRLAAIVATAAIGAGLVCLSVPAGLSAGEAVRWAVAGPVHVAATQATAVLAAVAAWRWESGRRAAVGSWKKHASSVNLPPHLLD